MSAYFNLRTHGIKFLASMTDAMWGADKSLAFPISYLQYNQKNFSWMG
jgi:hypothetical protein